MFGKSTETRLAKRVWKSGRAVNMAQGMFARQAEKSNAQLDHDLKVFVQHFAFEDSLDEGSVNFEVALKPFFSAFLYDINHPHNGGVEVSSLVANMSLHILSFHGASQEKLDELLGYMKIISAQIIITGKKNIADHERNLLISNVLKIQLDQYL